MITLTKSQVVALVLLAITVMFVSHAVGYAREEKTPVDIVVVQRAEDGAIIEVHMQRDGRPTTVGNLKYRYVDENGNDADTLKQ